MSIVKYIVKVRYYNIPDLLEFYEYHNISKNQLKKGFYFNKTDMFGETQHFVYSGENTVIFNSMYKVSVYQSMFEDDRTKYLHPTKEDVKYFNLRVKLNQI